MRAFKTAFVAVAIALGAPASAGPIDITFQTAPYGPNFTGPVTENGFTYMQTDGSLYVNQWGNPGQDMEAMEDTLGGSLVVFRTDGQLFTFNSIDFAAYEDTTTPQEQALSLVGVTKDGTQIQEYYTLDTTNVYDPTYSNWTTEFPTAGNLAGVELKSLAIVLFSIQSDVPCYGAVDNLNLTLGSNNPPVPEPATLALFGAGLLGFAARRRAKRT